MQKDECKGRYFFTRMVKINVQKCGHIIKEYSLWPTTKQWLSTVSPTNEIPTAWCTAWSTVTTVTVTLRTNTGNDVSFISFMHDIVQQPGTNTLTKSHPSTRWKCLTEEMCRTMTNSACLTDTRAVLPSHHFPHQSQVFFLFFSENIYEWTYSHTPSQCSVPPYLVSSWEKREQTWHELRVMFFMPVIKDAQFPPRPSNVNMNWMNHHIPVSVWMPECLFVCYCVCVCTCVSSQAHTPNRANECSM